MVYFRCIMVGKVQMVPKFDHQAKDWLNIIHLISFQLILTMNP